MTKEIPHLDAAFSALADPTRRAILARLALGETTVMEIARPFEMTQPAIRRVEGSKRPCRIAPDAIANVDRWLGMLRDALAKNYDRLDSVLASMMTEERKERP
jgi:DNA-binding transcriptional ArsR family regulator